jgi:hypothetical protein
MSRSDSASVAAKPSVAVPLEVDVWVIESIIFSETAGLAILTQPVAVASPVYVKSASSKSLPRAGTSQPLVTRAPVTSVTLVSVSVNSYDAS